jgi:hypothetical protein
MSTTLRPLRDADGNILDRNLAYARGQVRSVTYSSLAVGSSADFTAGTAFVEAVATSFCHVRFAASSSLATATSSDIPIPPNDRVILPTNGATRFAAIQDSAAGTLYLTEL